MLEKVTNIIDSKAVVAFAVLTSLIGFGSIIGHAQTSNADTTVNLSITAGVATLYAGDKNPNDDICTPGDDATTVESVPCTVEERSVDLAAKTVLNKRQETTALVYDILLDDLRGLSAAQYTVDALMCDLVGNQTTPVTYALGYTGDGGAPLYARTNASVGTVSAIKPASTVTAFTSGSFTKGSNTSVTSHTGTGDTISIFDTPADVEPGRYNIDAVEIGFQLPAYIETGAYTCDITYTLTL